LGDEGGMSANVFNMLQETTWNVKAIVMGAKAISN